MQNARSIYRLGFDHFVKGDLEQAVTLYREALSVDEGFTIAWTGLSMALARLGQLDEAIEAGRRVVELEPNDALSHTNLSRLLQQKGLIQEAEDERALALQLQE